MENCTERHLYSSASTSLISTLTLFTRRNGHSKCTHVGCISNERVKKGKRTGTFLFCFHIHIYFFWMSCKTNTDFRSQRTGHARCSSPRPHDKVSSEFQFDRMCGQASLEGLQNNYIGRKFLIQSYSDSFKCCLHSSNGRRNYIFILETM